jgi:hypothetical protein
MLSIIVLKITYAACLELLTKASTGGDHCWRITYAACLDLLTEASKGGHYCWRITYAACLKLLTEASTAVQGEITVGESLMLHV